MKGYNPTEVERERMNRIRISVAAYAYECCNEAHMTDENYDALSRSIRPEMSTGHPIMDAFFKKDFSPDTGMWIHKHPQLEGIIRYYNILKSRKGGNVKDEVQQAREKRKLNKRERKALAKAKANPVKPPEPPLWLKSNSMDPITTPMFPTQVPIRPTVLYTDKAWAKIQHLIRANTLEVGWWGTVQKDGNTYTILDVFVPKQEVSSGTTDISPDGLNKVVDDLLVSQGHADNLLYWGHLHPNFSCCPSTTDERTTQGFIDRIEAGSYFIRGIYNKSGESKVDIYCKDADNSGWIFQNVINTRIPAALSADEMNQFKETCKQNVSEYVPVVQRQPRAPTGMYTKVIPDPQRPGLYKLREGDSGNYRIPGLPHASASQELQDDLDDGIIDYEDLTESDLEILTDPYGVKGEGYARD